MTTDAKLVENLAGFSEVKGWKPSSRVGGRGQRGVLDVSTAAGAVVFRGGTEVASCFTPRGLAPHLNDGSGEVHVHQGVRMRGVHAGGELVRHPGGEQHGLGSVSSFNGQVWSAGCSKEARPRHADAKHGVGLDRWRQEWTHGVVQVAICQCCSAEESRDRDAETGPMGDTGSLLGSRTVGLVRNLRLMELQSTGLREAPRIRPSARQQTDAKPAQARPSTQPAHNTSIHTPSREKHEPSTQKAANAHESRKLSKM